jgi:hypothetical protein
LNITNIEREYARTITAMSRTEILILLPRSKKLGVIGIDEEEYPVPTREQLQEIFTHNKELVDRKMRQGFTQLQLTPIAMPVSQLIERVKTVVLKHAAAEKILQTKKNSTDSNIPVRVNSGGPIWMWDRVRQELDTANLVYFPRAYSDRDHRGLTKKQVIREIRLCAVPGWSVGLIEPLSIMPQQGQGRVIGGRKQLEEYYTPREYLQTLSTPIYEGETGWTPEDFLTHFVIRLEKSNQICHDRHDGNALWLLGSYMPDSMPNAKLVPVGYWDRDAGRRIRLSAHRTGNRLRAWVARSMVRLGG